MRSSRTPLTAAAVAVVAGVALLAPASAPSAATAVTGAEQILEACGAQTVCLFDGARISNAPELEAALPEGARVVVIPQPDQAESVQTSTIASQLQSATGARTVIVVEDRAKDRFAVASSDDAAAITGALYSQDETDGGVAVAAIAGTLAEASPKRDEAGPAVGGGAVVAGIAIAVAVVAAGGVLLVRRRARRGRERAAIPARLERELSAALHGADGAYIADALETLARRAPGYPDIGEPLSSLTRHVSELFVRVRKRGTDQQVRLLQAQYKDTLAKLSKAVNDDYYGDIVKNPQYWSDPAGRIAEVRRAIESVDQQAVENIRQVNESRDLEFKVALDSLIRTVAEAKLSDVYPDREQ